eukprot:2414912-Rhodomonas_salina.1
MGRLAEAKEECLLGGSAVQVGWTPYGISTVSTVSTLAIDEEEEALLAAVRARGDELREERPECAPTSPLSFSSHCPPACFGAALFPTPYAQPRISKP